MKKEELRELIREIIKEEINKNITEQKKKEAIEEKQQKPVEKEIIDYVVELGKNPTTKELGIYFGENSLLEREENALLIHYSYYKSEDVIEVIKWQRRTKERIRTNR